MRDRPPLVPERILLPPPPEDPALRSRWERLPFEERRRLARLAASPDVDADGDGDLVASLAHARLRTSWRLHASAIVLGWLVLSTIWGFGRAAFPELADFFLLTGLVAGAAAAGLAEVGARRRLRAARGVLRDRSP